MKFLSSSLHKNKKNKSLAPVAIFGYRRPSHLQQVLVALEKDPLACFTHVKIFLDGPKKIWDLLKTWQTYLVAAREWKFAGLRIYRSPHNLGLARSITKGVTEVLADAGKVIVLEDDIVPLPGFLRFMNEALIRYKGHKKIMQISAYAYPISHQSKRATLLSLTSCWGWGTWARAWRNYGLRRRVALRDLQSPSFCKKMDLNNSYPYSRLLKDVLEKKSNSWGVIWYWNLLKKQGLVLFPPESLVRNIGWDGSGVHGDKKGFGNKTRGKRGKIQRVIWPIRVRADAQYSRRLEKFLRRSIYTSTPQKN